MAASRRTSSGRSPAATTFLVQARPITTLTPDDRDGPAPRQLPAMRPACCRGLAASPGVATGAVRVLDLAERRASDCSRARCSSRR